MQTIGASIKVNLKLYQDTLIRNAIVISIGFDSEDPSLTWLVRSGFRDMRFSKETEIPSGRYWMPTTVFNLKKGNLSVAVVPDTIWLKLITFDLDDYNELYVSPYLNMMSDTTNCMGTAEPEQNFDNVSDLISAWTNGFFRAEFNQLTDNLNIPIRDYYKKAKKKTDFDKKIFKKLNKTLEEFIGEA